MSSQTSYLRIEDLRLTEDLLGNTIYRPSKRRLKGETQKPLSIETTSSGKHIVGIEDTDLYSKMPSPPWRVLSLHNACRLIDPNNRETKFFLPDEVGFNEAWVAEYNRQRVCSDTDIFLWVYSPGATPVRLPEESLQTKYHLLHCSSTTHSASNALHSTAHSPESPEEVVETPVDALVVGSSQGLASRYASTRRSGFIVLRSIHTSQA